MLTHNALIAQLRPLLHPMLVHFPIALLFASVALDWVGYWLKHPNLTRAGFYTLVLGAFAAGIAALSGPDHATGDPSVPALLAAHQTWASVTVGLAVVMVAARFITAHGLSGSGAILYLIATLALLVAVSLTGYFGGEMTYHHAVGVTVNTVLAEGSGGDATAVQPLIPAKPFVALIGFLAIVAFCAWLVLGRRLLPSYYPTWWRAVQQERANAGAPLWTLQRGLPSSLPTASQQHLWQAPHSAYPHVSSAHTSQKRQAAHDVTTTNDAEDEWQRMRSPRN